MTAPDPWQALRAHTAARIALGRAGVSLPTAEWLRFGQAHALARDAVHAALDVAALQAELQAEGWACCGVDSAAADRATYLRRPDLGRRLAPGMAEALAARPYPAEPAQTRLALVLADGLSATAVQRHAVPLLRALQPLLQARGFACSPVVLARQARVALGDAVAAALRADAVLLLVGERPGLSSPDSLGAYLTWAPPGGWAGCSDAQRNCVSNIRPEGQTVPQAAWRIAWLLQAARRLGASGVSLKDESDADTLQGPDATVHLR